MSFTRRTALGGAAALALSRARAAAAQSGGQSDEGQQFFLRLLKSSDESVAKMLKAPEARNSLAARRGGNVAALVAGYCAPESAYYKSESLVPLIEAASKVFVEEQHADGTLDAGNLSSPPDTAFVIEALAASLAVLRRVDDPRLRQTKDSLSKFLLAAGEALVTGGVHTPNHRWVICSALARIHALFPAPKYVNRIDDWLGEGVYQDRDGQFEERSTGIYSRVTCSALLTVSRMLNRPDLLTPVRRNLEMNLYYLHPNGELETVASRRQDANMILPISNYYLQYRHMALRDNDGRFGAVVTMLQANPEAAYTEGSNPVIYFIEEPALKRPVPTGGGIPSDYAKVFSNSGLARIRRGDISATVYGGSDWPLGVASGLASNPTFFTFRKGKAILQSVRMGAEFFGEGAFRSEGLKASGNEYSLHQRFDVPYYQPLPKKLRNSAGDYKLTPARDERFWSKLDFPNRQMGNVQTLDQKVTVVEKQGVFELHFDISGHDRVPFLVELAFRAGGEFSGPVQKVATRGGTEAYFLKEGTGRYRVGDDTVEFGPGMAEHQLINLSGPSYAAHGASLKASGVCVYITGFTPFRNVLTIRGV